MKKISSDKLFDFINVIVMVGLFVIFTYPIWFVLIASISNPGLLHAGKVLLWPKEITLDGYTHILQDKSLWNGYLNTIIVTVGGTCLSMLMSICVAYPLANKRFRMRKGLTVFYMITMYFNGGLIPTYLLYRDLHLLNTRWVLIIPSLVSIYNCLILRSYFQNSIPEELREAATIDGASPLQYLMKVVIPLSKPVFAVISLYYMVTYWNNYTNSLYYTTKPQYETLQAVLRRLLTTTQLLSQVDETGMDAAVVEMLIQRVDVMKYGVIMVAAIPMLCVYPFIQKYFVKGTMVGAVKG